jgi:hypothetical protein
MQIGIIGGGAAGFFAAITAKENYPEARVVIFEKSAHLLSKVKISGGGRCNVTNSCKSIGDLCKAYPRGGKSLKKAFHQFSNHDAMAWFQSRGVALVTQDDGCVFPSSQSSMSIINCFLQEAKRLNVEVLTGMGVEFIRPDANGQELNFLKDDCNPLVFDKVIVATGGSPKMSGLEWLAALNHKVELPVPSLFTFNMPGEDITRLMGVVVENVSIGLQGTRLKSEGPLLITHWGMSGPAVLKLSSYGARLMNEAGYDFKVQVNWANEVNQDLVYDYLKQISVNHPQKQMDNLKPYNLPERLWVYLLAKCELSPQKKWGEAGKSALNRLMNVLTNDVYAVKGKTTFREEFVTCGGVSLENVDMTNMKSKVVENLYFAGEVLDIDAITGGYNLQAAWTTGYVAGQLQ